MASSLAVESSPTGNQRCIEPHVPSMSDAVVSQGICSTIHRIFVDLFKKALPCLASRDDTDDGLNSPEGGVVTARVMMAVIGGQDDLTRRIFNASSAISGAGINLPPQTQTITPSCSASPESSPVEHTPPTPEAYTTVDSTQHQDKIYAIATVEKTVTASPRIKPTSEIASKVVLDGTSRSKIRCSSEGLKVMVSRPSSLDILASLDTFMLSSPAQCDLEADPFNTPVQAIVASCSGSSSLPAASIPPVNDADAANVNASHITAFVSNPVPNRMSIGEFNQQQERIHEYRRLGGSADTMIMYLENRRERQRQADNGTILSVLHALSTLDGRVQDNLDNRGTWPAPVDEEKLETTWVDRRPFYFCPPPSLASSPSVSDIAAGQETGKAIIHPPSECSECLNTCPTCALEWDAQGKNREPSSSEDVEDVEAVLEPDQFQDASVVVHSSSEPANGVGEDSKHKNKVQNRQLNIYDLSIYYPQTNRSNIRGKGRTKKNKSTTPVKISKENAFKAYLSATKVVVKDNQKVHRWLVKQSQVDHSLTNGDDIRIWTKISRHKSAPSLGELRKSDREVRQPCHRRASIAGNLSFRDPFLLASSSDSNITREFPNFLTLSPIVPPSAALEGHSELLSGQEKYELVTDSMKREHDNRQLLDSGPYEPCFPPATSSSGVTRKLLSSPPASMLEPAPRRPLRAKRIRGKFISEVIHTKEVNDGETETEHSLSPGAEDGASRDSSESVLSDQIQTAN